MIKTQAHQDILVDLKKIFEQITRFNALNVDQTTVTRNTPSSLIDQLSRGGVEQINKAISDMFKTVEAVD